MMLEQERPWSDKQVDEALWELSKEFTEASMLVYAHAVAFGRHRVPAGPPGTLLAAMRESLCRDPGFTLPLPHFRPDKARVPVRPRLERTGVT